jgi:hypothetical protein
MLSLMVRDAQSCAPHHAGKHCGASSRFSFGRLWPRRRILARLDTVIASGVGSKTVIARSEATKQSIVTIALAVDCFAEPVIGRAFARPVGSQ